MTTRDKRLQGKSDLLNLTVPIGWNIHVRQIVPRNVTTTALAQLEELKTVKLVNFSIKGDDY